MLENIDFSQEHLTKEEYKSEHDALVKELILLQQEAVRKGVGLVVLFEGWDGAGKGSRISDLVYNLDARATTVYVAPGVETLNHQAFTGGPSGVTGYFPEMQEYWNALGPRGSITFYDQGWYSKATRNMVDDMMNALPGLPGEMVRKNPMTKGKKNKAGAAVAEQVSRVVTSERSAVSPLSRYLASASDFERQLADDGYLVIKFFVHVSAKAQAKRLHKLHDDPATAWRVSEQKLNSVLMYDQAYTMYDALLEGSNFTYAPWTLVNGEDKRAANLTIARTLVDALKTRLNQGEDPAAAAAAAKAAANSAGKLNEAKPELTEEEKRAAAQEAADLQSSFAPRHSRYMIKANHPTVDSVDHTLALEWDDYKAQLKKEQERLNKLEMEMFQRRIPMVIMYEGWDAAGKGGSIKRVAQALDARAYSIFTSPAPTKPELMHPFLWRYWTRLPKAGHVGIYDRSWYGRVLVERVEGFASPAEWSRAYDEINEFERELVRWGAILLKFWVDISPDEQLNRFHARMEDPAKQWKITDEDWRNREKYPQYKAAVDDMFRLTSTTYAPWHVLESDNKLHARVKALKIINAALEERLGL